MRNKYAHDLNLITNPEVETVFSDYPSEPRKKLLLLRELIIESASELEDVNHLEETLKWGEPSYLAKRGSTIRIDWKPKNPNKIAIYFKCTSRLVETFKITFPDSFVFEGNRAIVFNLEEEIPKNLLKKCLKAALRYHRVKHLPSLGIE